MPEHYTPFVATGEIKTFKSLAPDPTAIVKDDAGTHTVHLIDGSWMVPSPQRPAVALVGAHRRT